jgi:putative membrane protein
LFDPGQQLERTVLAWRRTALALAGAALLIGRVLFEALGLWTLVPTLWGLLTAVVIVVGSELRYRRSHDRLTTGGDLGPPIAGGGLPALLVIGVLVLAACSILLAVATDHRLRVG